MKVFGRVVSVNHQSCSFKIEQENGSLELVEALIGNTDSGVMPAIGDRLSFEIFFKDTFSHGKPRRFYKAENIKNVSKSNQDSFSVPPQKETATVTSNNLIHLRSLESSRLLNKSQNYWW